MGWRRPDPSLNKVAHFTQYAGGRRSRVDDRLHPADRIAGATTTDVHTVDGGWLWYIPLSGDVVSVGAVLDAHVAGRLAGEPEAVFERALADCPRVLAQLAGARRTMPVQTISGISYINESFAGDGFVLVGDASMFVDPIFSAGVTLAVRGGIYAADTIVDAFQHATSARRASRRTRRASARRWTGSSS
jgi:halogenation protein CepH